MIQVNLLPEEFRRPDRTPMPLFLTVVFGIISVAILGMWLFALSSSLQNLEEANEQLQGQKATWSQRATVVDKLNREISTQKKRQNTIIGISLSKIMWSQKLIQLSRILDNDFEDFWIRNMTMTQTAKGGTLVLTSLCQGEDFARVSDFRNRLKNNPNFWYHFKAIRAPVIRRQGNKLSFNLTLLLRG